MLYLVWRQTNIAKYRWILIVIFLLGVILSIVMSTWGIPILNQMFGIASGSVSITWIAAIFALLLFFISTLLYSFMHITYWDLPTLLLTLLAGLFWRYHYSQFKNIYSTIASHIFLGVLAIITGIV
jgi:membrane protease YdiL (CAAX protease family)